MKNTFAVLSIIRTSKRNSEGKVPVYLRITCDGKRCEISTKAYVDPEKWNPEKGRVNGFNNYCRFLNNSIESFEHRAKEIYNVFIQRVKSSLLWESKRQF